MPTAISHGSTDGYALRKLLPPRPIQQQNDSPLKHKHTEGLALLWFLNTAMNHFDCSQLMWYSA